MSVRPLLTAGLAMLLLGGCRYDPHMQLYVDNVNAEKRLLEDTLYDLQYDYECKIQEVDKLRSELTQLKSGETTGGTSRAGAGSSRKSDTPAGPGDNLFPDIPELKPPTVEPGTPEPARTPEPAKAPAQERPRKLDNMDDLEPPTLDLGDEQSGTSAASKPVHERVAAPEPAPEPARDTTSRRPGKLASRWTPRADRPQEPPARRINVAESPGQQRTDSGTPAGGRDQALGPGDSSSSGAGAASEQARRPQWRPYR